MPYVNLRPSQVLLDPENPRLPEGTSSDREAINRLLNEGPEALVNLARDLAQTGQTNPTELPIAIRQGAKYLVLEGNRRFAALKLLNDPKLADSELHQQAFRRAAALGSPPKTVYTHVMASREEADRWIVLRHTGENNGRGVRRWSAGQAATHRSRANKIIDSGTARSIALADALEAAYEGDSRIAELVRQVRTEKLTNIGRFFSPDVLMRVGLSIDADRASPNKARTVWAKHSAEQLRDFFVWSMKFIADNSVDAYKNSKVRGKVLDAVSSLIPDVVDELSAPMQLGGTDTATEDPAAEAGGHREQDAAYEEAADDHREGTDSSDPEARDDGDPGKASDSPAGATARPAGGSRSHEAKLEKYLFQGLRLPNHNARTQRLLGEARTLELSQYAGVCCVMVRVLVELSVSSTAALALSGARENDSLREKILAMLRHLDPNIDKPMKADAELAQAYLEASELGVRYLNGFVHNPTVRPDEQLARRFSSAFRPLLVRVDKAL